MAVVNTPAAWAQTITTIVGDGVGGPATNTEFNHVSDVYVDADGTILTATRLGGAGIRRIDPVSGLVSRVAGYGGRSSIVVLDPVPIGEIGILPLSVHVDPAGDPIFFDGSSHSLIRVDLATGLAERLAGLGFPGYFGDGGSATLSALNIVSGLSVAANGDIYLADTNNHRIRKIDATSGIITTVAGDGTEGFAGGGLAVDAFLDNPSGVFITSAGEVFIADKDNHRIRKVSTGGAISTIAGTGVATYTGDGGLAAGAALNKPEGVFVASDASIYIADTGNDAIRKIVGGTITTVVGGLTGFDGDGGQATLARLDEPRKVWVDAVGDIYIADRENFRVRMVDISTGIISTIAGGGIGDGLPAFQSSLNSPSGVFVNTIGDIYIADRYHHVVRKVDASTGLISTVAGTGISGFSGDNGPAVVAQLDTPWDVHLDADDNIYISDRENQRIRRVDATTGIITTVVGSGAQGFGGDLGPATGASLNDPGGIFVSSAGDIYFADEMNNRVRKVTGGIVTTVAGDGTQAGGGDGGLATSAQVSSPNGVFVNAAGDLYIAHGWIRKVDASTGIISTISSTVEALDVFVDVNGDIFVASPNQIRLVDETTGTWTAYAGTDDSGFSGDGGAAIDAKITSAEALFGDADGNLYIADAESHRIRKITPGPAAPVLVDFAGLTNLPYKPTLEWNDVNNAVSYTLEWSNDAAFTISTIISGISQSQYTFNPNVA